jgi:ornithine carbamoyltransferase
MTSPLQGRDLLSLADLTPDEITLVLDTAAEQKAAWAAGEHAQPLAGLSAALIFQKPSLRTRVSFEVACARLGVHPVPLVGQESAFSRGESVHDTAKVMERYVEAIVIRTFEQSLVEELAEHATVPVINALTDDYHPCQGLADLLTIREHLGSLTGARIAYVGDGNNMAHTYALAAALTGMHLTLACPESFEPSSHVILAAEGIAAQTGASIVLAPGGANGVKAAVEDAQVVLTDTWASMGQEEERAVRLAAFEGYTIDSAVMDAAASDAVFMHCLPAHRGEEVTDDVMDGTCSVIFDEAENRLHAQKALLSLVMSGA